MKEAMDRRGVTRISQLPLNWVEEVEAFYSLPEAKKRARAILKERFPETASE